jgi:hypothetical protein
MTVGLAAMPYLLAKRLALLAVIFCDGGARLIVCI